MRHALGPARAFRILLSMAAVWLTVPTEQLSLPAQPLAEVDGAARRLTDQSPRTVFRPELSGDFDQTWVADGSGTWTLAGDALVLESAGTLAGPIQAIHLT